MHYLKHIETSVKRSIEDSNWILSSDGQGQPRRNFKLNKYLDQFKVGIVEGYQQLLLQKNFIIAELLQEKVTGVNRANFIFCKLMKYAIRNNLFIGAMHDKTYYITPNYIKERFKKNDK